MNERIISNKIKTPDGTILQSFHRHDYKTYIDANGFEYMVDGGTDYLRRTLIEEYPYEELSVYSDAPFETIRQELHWGTRGKDGKQPLTWKPLCELSTKHINAILTTQTHIESWLYRIFEQELEYRND
jgi:hypothetical protein